MCVQICIDVNTSASYEFINSDTMKRLFIALIRPHLEFSNVAWAPRLIRKLIEGVQRRGTKLVPDIRELPYQQRPEQINTHTHTHIYIYKFTANINLPLPPYKVSFEDSN